MLCYMGVDPMVSRHELEKPEQFSQVIRDTAERSDRSFLVAFQNYKFNCATENSKLLLSVFVSESVVMAGILNTTFVHSTNSAT